MAPKLRPTKRMLERRAKRAERATLRHAHKFLIGRWDNLREARRDITSWLLLIAVLIAIGVVQMISYNNSYKIEAAASGGTYAEGIIGNINNINPLYAETDNERAVSSLVFSGLFRYADGNNIQGELASRWSVSDDGKTYDITLRDNVRFQDGEPVTADDVIFTINIIKNPKVGSVLYNNWRTIEVSKLAPNRVRFELKSPYASFLHALTFGILPKHTLDQVAPETLREFVADNRVVGAGPYILRSIQAAAGNSRSVIYMTANNHYFRREPRTNFVQIRVYSDSATLARGFGRSEVNAAAGLNANGAAVVADDTAGTLVQAPLYDGVFALFNTTSPVMSDKSIRAALRLGTDIDSVRESVVSGGVRPPSPLNGPLVSGLFQSVDELSQPTTDVKAATEKLSSMGYKLNADNKLQKDDQLLHISMVTVKDTDYAPAAENLAQQWQDLGVDVELIMANPENAGQNYFIPRNYDVLVYQLHMGADADVFAYWHSSEATARGLNFANYSSLLADASLVSGRARSSDQLREAKYKTFVETWLDDVPAIALYRPDYYYAHAPSVRSLSSRPLVSAADRFSGVHTWTVKTDTFYATP